MITALQNNHMTAETALRWSLETMETLRREEDARIRSVQMARERNQRIVQDSISYISKLVELQDSQE